MNIISFFINNRTTSAIIIIYLIFNALIYTHHESMVYDEAWFTCCKNHKQYTNFLGYGYLYWAFIGLVKSTLALRIFSFFCLIAILYSLYIFANNNGSDETKLRNTILLWLTFPAAWWYGKLIGPELYCMAIASVGLAMSINSDAKSNQRRMIGIFLQGIAAGIKINFILISIFYYSYSLLKTINASTSENTSTTNIVWTFAFKSEKLGLPFALGFIAGSPSILWQPLTFLDNLAAQGTTSLNWIHLKYLYTTELLEFWETVIVPSIASFTLSIPALIFLCILSLRKRLTFDNQLLAMVFAVTILIFVFMLVKSKLYWPWYAHPIIILFLFLITKVSMSAKSAAWLISINLFFNAPVIFLQATEKIIHIDNQYYSRPEIDAAIEKHQEIFLSKYESIDVIISLNPREGTQIITLNEHVNDKKPFSRPTFIAVSKVMITGKQDTVYHRIWETFADDKMIRLQSSLNHIAMKNNDTLLNMDINNDVYIFGYIPHSAK